MWTLRTWLCGEQTLYIQINNPFTNLKLERNFMKQTYNIGLKNPDNSQSKNNWFIRLHYFLYAERKSPRNIFCVRSYLSVSEKQKEITFLVSSALSQTVQTNLFNDVYTHCPLCSWKNSTAVFSLFLDFARSPVSWTIYSIWRCTQLFFFFS